MLFFVLQGLGSRLYKHHSVYVLGFIIGVFAHASFANEGSLQLEMVDNFNQQAVSYANVHATSREGASHESQADSNGRMLLPELLPGLYEVLIRHPNYQTLRIPSMRVTNNKTTFLKVKLIRAISEIEQVLVMSEAVSADLKSSVATSVIDREALRSAAGSGSDVLRALDGLPGLFSDGEYSSYTVRGNSPRDNLILVDGIPFENVVHFSDSFGEQDEIEGGGRYSIFAPNIIGSSTFQPGGWSSAHAGRSGSLLELEVAEGNIDTPSYTLRLDLAGIEVGYDGPSVIHDGTSVLFSARSLNFENLFKAIGLNDVGEPALTDIILKTSTELMNGNELQFLLIHAPEKYSRNLENVLASDENEPGNFKDISLIEAESNNTLMAATWSQGMGENSELISRLYYKIYAEKSSNGEAYPDLVPLGTPKEQVPVRNNIIKSTREENELGLRLDLHTENSLGRVSTGLRAAQVDLTFDLTLDDDWIRYTYNQNDYRPNAEQQYLVLMPDTLNVVYQQKHTTFSAYFDQEIVYGNWDFRAGARVDRDEYSKQTIFSPRFGSTWQASDVLRVTSSVGRYHQTPRFSDRAINAGKPPLESELIDQLSLGFNYSVTDEIDFFVEPYYQRQSNLISKANKVNKTFSNSGEGRSYGVDTALSKKFDNGWSASINYSYNSAKTKNAKSLPFYKANFSRPHALSFGGVWEVNSRWKISGRWKWASGKPKSEYIVHENVLGNGEPLRYSREIIAFNTAHFERYNSFNFRVDYRREFGGVSTIAFIDMINVLGSDNPSNSNFNERIGEVIVEKGSLLPLFGLRFEW